MDPPIIDRAREILGTQTDALENLLAEVERQSQELGIRLRKTEQQEERYTRLAEEYACNVKGFKEEGRRIKQSALKDAERILADANAAVEEAIREIRERQAAKGAIRHAHETVERKKESVRAAVTALQPEDAPAKSTDADTIHAGDEVAMKEHPSTKGVALEEPQKGKVTVAFGSMRMKVEVAHLERLQQNAAHATVSTTHVQEPIERNEIDVRGMYGDEAIREIDRFLYQAWSMGMRRIDIIHGKGTGALRKRVHTFLRDLPFIDHFMLGEWNEGGSGMTKVYFREE